MFKLIKFYVLRQNLQNSINQPGDKKIGSINYSTLDWGLEMQINVPSACSSYLLLHNKLPQKVVV